MKGISSKTIIFILVVILFVGLFYSVAKSYRVFDAIREGASSMNEFDNWYNTYYLPSVNQNKEDLENIIKKNRNFKNEYNNNIEQILKVLKTSNTVQTFKMSKDPTNMSTDQHKTTDSTIQLASALSAIITDSNKESLSTIVDKIITILNDIKYTYLAKSSASSKLSTVKPAPTATVKPAPTATVKPAPAGYGGRAN
jgi:predicted PurR-regulated permease PerM